jgi:hypothetical protein
MKFVRKRNRATALGLLSCLLLAAACLGSPGARAQDVQPPPLAGADADRVPLPEPATAGPASGSSPLREGEPGSQPAAESTPPRELEILEFLHQDVFEVTESSIHDPWITPGVTRGGRGLRSVLSEAGILISARTTQFGFGIVGGIDRPLPPSLSLPLGKGNVFKYTGRAELDAILDLEKYLG